MTFTLKNYQSVSLNFTGISFSGANAGDFTQTNTCGSSLAANTACTISVTFTPSATGQRQAVLVVNDDAPGSPQTTPLTGVGQ